MLSNFKQELFFPLLFLTLGIFVFIESNSFPETAAFFPKLLSVLLIFFSLIIFINILQKNNIEKNKINGNYNTKKITSKEGNNKTVYILLIGLILYTILIKYLGYVVSTIILVYYTIFSLNYEKKRSILFISIIIGFILYFIFKYIFKTPLPPGIIFGIFKN